jgi:hypothetical protein
MPAASPRACHAGAGDRPAPAGAALPAARRAGYAAGAAVVDRLQWQRNAAARASIEDDFAARARIGSMPAHDRASRPRGSAAAGIGRYPAPISCAAGRHRADHSLQAEAAIPTSVGGRSPIYLEQIVALQPNRPYQVRLRARSRDADAVLNVPMCEKWMLYSRRCVWKTLEVGDTDGKWKWLSATFVNRSLGSAPGLAAPTVKLSLFSEPAGSEVEIDDISMTDAGGRELVRNGTFGKGLDFWRFSSDNHQPWHLENTWLQVLFEQGLAGVAAFAGLVLCAVSALARRLRAADPFAPALTAALATFLALSLLNSVLDFPRIALLVYLILLLTLSDVKKSIRSGNPG